MLCPVFVMLNCVNLTASSHILLRHFVGLVCSVFESKGLEFNDVLLYNFFTDSPAKNEWRCVIDLIAESTVSHPQTSTDTISGSGISCTPVLSPARVSQTTSSTSTIAEGGRLERKSGRNAARRLAFDDKQHKILLDELRHLYTAITRSRVNVWIYDECVEARSPMFKFFQAKDLVRVVHSVLDLDELKITKGALTSQAEWVSQGKALMEKQAYSLAQICFQKGCDERLRSLAEANKLARMQTSVQESAEQRSARFLEAGKLFLQSRSGLEGVAEAAYCLRTGGRPLLSAELYMALNREKQAARCYLDAGKLFEFGSYQLRSKRYSGAYESFLKCNSKEVLQGAHLLIQECKGSMAIDLLTQTKQFGEAFHLFDIARNNSPADFVTSRTPDDLAFAEAKQVDKFDSLSMLSWLKRIVLKENIDKAEWWLLSMKLVEELVEYLSFHKKYGNVAQVLCELKQFERAAHFLGGISEKDKSLSILRARCLLKAGHAEEAKEEFDRSGERFLANIASLSALSKERYAETICGEEIQKTQVELLRTQLSSFLGRFDSATTGVVWGVVWTLNTAHRLLGDNCFEMIMPDGHIANSFVITEILRGITALVSGMEGKFCSDTEMFFEFTDSAIVPGNVRFDLLASRVPWILEEDESVHQKTEWSGSAFYFIIPRDKLFPMIKRRLLTTVLCSWPWTKFIKPVFGNLWLIDQYQFQSTEYPKRYYAFYLLDGWWKILDYMKIEKEISSGMKNLALETFMTCNSILMSDPIFQLKESLLCNPTSGGWCLEPWRLLLGTTSSTSLGPLPITTTTSAKASSPCPILHLNQISNQLLKYYIRVKVL